MNVLRTPTDRRAPIALETDILVVGGGAAGVAAAVTAARQGLRVVLLERYGFCGGGAVAGLSGTICGMYEASDDPNARPNQIVHGFLDEFVQHLSDRGGLTPPVRYGKTFTRVHDPLVWRETADRLLRDAGTPSLRPMALKSAPTLLRLNCDGGTSGKTRSRNARQTAFATVTQKQMPGRNTECERQAELRSRPALWQSPR